MILRWPTAVIAASAVLHAMAQNPAPTCRAPLLVQSTASLRELPAPIRNALLQRVPDIVDANQPFDATDVVMYGAHFNRFAFAWHGRGRWIVATERGGIAYSNPIYTISWRDPAQHETSLAIYPAQIVAVSSSRPAWLCTAVKRAMKEPLPTLPSGTPESNTQREPRAARRGSCRSCQMAARNRTLDPGAFNTKASG